MYSDIAIIGLGTIGGFLSKNLSKLESLKSLVIIDYDVVETSNLKNSIYVDSDVGKSKVDCIYNIIHNLNNDLNIIKIKERYIEGKTKIPKCDLVIDCRDFIYDRGSEINVRLYLSSRYLIVDCKKDSIYKAHYEGKYIDNLIKSEVISLTSNFINLVLDGSLTDIIDNNLIYQIDLDLSKKLISNKIMDHKNKQDLIIDHQKGIEEFHNFFEKSEEIIQKNKRREVKLCFGSVLDPLSNIKTIPMNSIQNENHLMKIMLSMVQYPNKYASYIISPEIVNNNYYVILIPETGSA